MSLVWTTIAALVVAWLTEPWYGIAFLVFGVIAGAIDRFVADREMPVKEDKKDA
jgi:hypothetical protein